MCRTGLVLLLFLASASLLFARSNYRGYSGAPGSLGTCASSCHGQNNGTVEISGFPDSYVPDSTYLITIEAVSGSSINNFNGSVRIGTGSTNAGTISAGTNTATYNVSQETNGIHLSANNRTSGAFSWLAPAAGSGTVRLYIGAFQGTSMNNGQNSDFTLVANEAVIETPPGQASNPSPANGATGVATQVLLLSWDAADRADSYEVYFGSGDSLPFLVATDNTVASVLLDLAYETTYSWRVDALNEFGTTTGVVWAFTTEQAPPPLPGQAHTPNPANGAVSIPATLNTVAWGAAEWADGYNLYFGTTTTPPQIATVSVTSYAFMDALDFNTTYFWRVDAHNITGTTPGPLWSFTTEVESAVNPAALPLTFGVGEAYPNPFNSSVRIELSLPVTSIVSAHVYDRTGRLVSALLENTALGGQATLSWDARGHSAGIYFLRCESGSHSVTQKLIFLP